MAFKLLTPKLRGVPITPGTVCIDTRGAARIAVADLAAVGIVDSATILYDTKTRRVAIRCPRMGETAITVNAPKTKRSKCVRIGQAIVALGITRADAAGRRPLIVDKPNKVLMISL